MDKLRGRFDSGKYSIYLILLVVFVAASLLSENFLSEINLLNVLRQVAVITIIAYGAMTLIIGGMIDLSAGAVMALSGVLAVDVYKSTGSLVLAVLTGIAVGVVCNLINAIMVANFKAPAFIATLAMMMMARGAVLQYTQGQNILQLGDLTVLGQGAIGRVPIPVIFLIVITVVIWYFMTQTRYGRAVYAIGGNEIAARASGINVTKTKYQAFLVNGALVGFAGVIFMARVNAGLPNAGVGYELQAITAPIIGGTSFTGGIGTTAGTLAGALIVGILSNIMNLTGVGSYMQQIAMGVVIAVAVMYDIRSRSRQRTEVILHDDPDEPDDAGGGDRGSGEPPGEPRSTENEDARR
ncbi:ABC transporter permease [Nitriliruptoraceae bacterium ZYF776]|nr:ABC transporter permease [Profundirhabdus halotolerans]